VLASAGGGVTVVSGPESGASGTPESPPVATAASPVAEASVDAPGASEAEASRGDVGPPSSEAPAPGVSDAHPLRSVDAQRITTCGNPAAHVRCLKLALPAKQGQLGWSTIAPRFYGRRNARLPRRRPTGAMAIPWPAVGQECRRRARRFSGRRGVSPSGEASLRPHKALLRWYKASPRADKTPLRWHKASLMGGPALAAARRQPQAPVPITHSSSSRHACAMVVLRASEGEAASARENMGEWSADVPGWEPGARHRVLLAT
jgi:hypothetical protein